MLATNTVTRRPASGRRSRTAWRDALAGRELVRGVGPRRTVPRRDGEQKGLFDVTILGCELISQTWDNATRSDGKDDELFFDWMVRGVDAAGSTFFEVHQRTPVFGDVNRQPGRIRAGSASPQGGLRSGDRIQLAQRVFRGELAAGQTALVVVPSVWEHDGSPSLLQGWLDAVSGAAAEVATLVQTIATTAGRPAIASIAEAAGLTLPTIVDQLERVVGRAESRPIGMEMEDGELVFNPVALALNLDNARFLANADFGEGFGVVAITFRDAPELRGECKLLLQVREEATPAPDPNVPIL